MINYNGKKDCDSNHMLIIWSIIGLKWAAYVTIPFIIILFKWTNYMMAFPLFPFSEVLQRKFQSSLIYSLHAAPCNVTLIDWQNNWSHFVLDAWSLWYMSLLIPRVHLQSILEDYLFYPPAIQIIYFSFILCLFTTVYVNRCLLKDM